MAWNPAFGYDAMVLTYNGATWDGGVWLNISSPGTPYLCSDRGQIIAIYPDSNGNISYRVYQAWSNTWTSPVTLTVGGSYGAPHAVLFETNVQRIMHILYTQNSGASNANLYYDTITLPLFTQRPTSSDAFIENTHKFPNILSDAEVMDALGVRHQIPSDAYLHTRNTYGLTSGAQIVAMIDQSYTENPYNYVSPSSNYEYEQKFVASISGKLSSIDVYAGGYSGTYQPPMPPNYQAQYPTYLLVAIYSDNNGNPGTSMASVSLTINGAGWYTANFTSSGLHVYFGTAYHIVVTAYTPQQPAYGNVEWYYGNTNIPSGMVAQQSTNGTTWTPLANTCFLFREYIVPSPVHNILADTQIYNIHKYPNLSSDAVVCAPWITIDSYVKLMMHFDNNLVDSELTPKTGITSHGIGFSNTIAKWDYSVLCARASQGYVYVPYSNDFNFGSGDFTVECWAYFTSAPGTGSTRDILLSRINSSDNGWVLWADSSGLQFGYAVASNPSGNSAIYGSNTWKLNTWYHCAFVRFGNIGTVYVNGIAVGTGSIYTGTIRDSSLPLYIGAMSNPVIYDDGYIDEVRISKGIARWQTNFTPPPAPYSTSTEHFANSNANIEVLGQSTTIKSDAYILPVSQALLTNETNTGYYDIIGTQQQHRVFKTSDGKIVLFAVDANTGLIKYDVSIDDGITWAGWTTVVSNTPVKTLDVYQDGSDNFYLAWSEGTVPNAYQNFVKMTYLSGSWTVGSVVSLVSANPGNCFLNDISITMRANGDIMIAGQYTITSVYHLPYWYSTDGGATFTSGLEISTTITSPQEIQLVPVGANIWAFIRGSSTLNYHIYSGSWSSGAGTVIGASSYSHFNVYKISDTNISVACEYSSGYYLYVFTYNGSSWSSVQIGTSYGYTPYLCYNKGYLILVYIDSTRNILCSIRNNGIWSTPMRLTTDADGGSTITYKSPNLISLDSLLELHMSYAKLNVGTNKLSLMYNTLQLLTPPILDQSYITSSSNMTISSSPYTGDQSFVAGQSGTLYEIDLYVYCSQSSNTPLQVGFYSDNAGNPGTLLESATILAFGNYASAWKQVFFSGTTQIVLGTKYHIVLSYPGSGYYEWYYGTTSIPSGMVMKMSYNNGSTWSTQSGECFCFKEFLTPPVTRKPMISADTKIQAQGHGTIDSDARIISIGLQDTINSDAYVYTENQHLLNADANIEVLGAQETLDSDAFVVYRYSDTIFADAYLHEQHQQPLPSDTKIKTVGNQQTLNSDAQIVNRITWQVFSHANIRVNAVHKINNKVSFLTSISNKVNNYFSMFAITVKKCNNTFAMRAQGLYKCRNDFRMLLPHQIVTPPAPPSTPPSGLPHTPTPLPLPVYQSFGKTYIHVYIDSVEQTDVDVDSITITKELNNAHTASLLLARPYDADLPDIESLIEIKYNTWTLYRGYITIITPTDNPECVRLECKDEMWKQNKNRVYFLVGHKPKTSPTAQTFYKTISDALSALGIGGIGNFIPQTINAWGKGKSEAVTELVTSAGNFNWFYDVNGSPVIETDGAGSVISLEAQDFDTQLNLHQVLNQSFKYDASSVINVFRVQMGNYVDRGGNQQFAGGDYATFTFDVTPTWDASKEILADGDHVYYDFRYPPKNDTSFEDVHRKFQLYDLETDPTATNSALHWTDRYAPVVSIEPAMFNYNNNIGNNIGISEVITEGYTIDYKNKTITFNKPVYQFATDAYGQIISIKSARISVMMIAEYLFPQLTVGSPLSFDTPKMGDYPTTYNGDIALSGLNIQVGKFYMGEDKLLHYIPAWNDTAFARDLAMFQLSKICNEKIDGTIDLTLDAVCTYDIDLSKQIVIPGIMETALNIRSMSYRLSDFQVTLHLDRGYNYQRSVSLQSRGNDWF